MVKILVKKNPVKSRGGREVERRGLRKGRRRTKDPDGQDRTGQEKRGEEKEEQSQ